ncbi:MAG: glycosyltransferase, partial [Flavisolibacter sp.]|nr:glycosyltransferase [Flavisolibacter sp.]
MKYSIILPVRNGGHYIKKCVASILSQTRQDYNLIVLENCSTDGTAEWLRNINNPKISVIEAPRSL